MQREEKPGREHLEFVFLLSEEKKNEGVRRTEEKAEVIELDQRGIRMIRNS